VRQGEHEILAVEISGASLIERNPQGRPSSRPQHSVRRPAKHAGGRLGALLGGLLALVWLAAAVPPALALDPKDREVVGQAFQAAGRGEWQRAWRLLEPVADPLPAKTLRWWRMMEDRQPADFATLARFVMANPDWPYRERLQAIAEEMIRDPADHALIRRFFADHQPLTTRGRIRYAQALFQIDKDEEAIALIRKAWVEGDFSAREDKRFARTYRRYLREQDHIERLDSLLWDQRRTSARRMLDRVPPGYRRLAEARMALQRRRAGVDRAIEAVPAALRDHPGLVFERLRWRRKSRLYDGVEEILLDPPDEIGRADRWWFERSLEIRRSLRRRDFERAYRLAASHRQTAGENYAEATWLWGWLALRFAQQPGEGFRRFTEMYEAVSSPTSRGRAAYWAGRSAAAMEDMALARYWYRVAAQQRISYYGQLAAIELGAPPQAQSVVLPGVEGRALFEGREVVRVAQMLVEIGADRWLRPFAMHLIGEAASPAEVAMAADVIAASGRADLVALAARAAAHRGQVHEAAAFPIPALESLLVQEDGDPEPALVLGVARQESGFNSFGQSHAGARGVLQLMPRTAHLMARSLKLPYNRARLTADPDYNIRLGRHYLRTLLDRYDGEVVLAMSAYNAGPRRAEQWLELNGDPRRGTLHDLVDWVELIPFDETRNYIQRVLEARTMYRERLADSTAERIPFLPVAGPIRPIPRPQLRPPGAAEAFAIAAVVARAPLPRLKPLEIESALLPGTDALAFPIPDAGPPARVAQLTDPTGPFEAELIARQRQDAEAPSWIPRARPHAARLDSIEGEPSEPPTRPELKPGGQAMIGAKKVSPPQPEPKPAHP